MWGSLAVLGSSWRAGVRLRTEAAHGVDLLHRRAGVARVLPDRRRNSAGRADHGRGERLARFLDDDRAGSNSGSSGGWARTFIARGDSRERSQLRSGSLLAPSVLDTEPTRDFRSPSIVDSEPRPSRASACSLRAPTTSPPPSDGAVQHQATPRTAFSTSLSYHHIELESDEPILGLADRAGGTPLPRRLSASCQDHPTTALSSSLTSRIPWWTFSRRKDSRRPRPSRTTRTRVFGVNHRLSEYSSLGFDLMGGYRAFDSDTSAIQDRRGGANAGLRGLGAAKGRAIDQHRVFLSS